MARQSPIVSSSRDWTGHQSTRKYTQGLDQGWEKFGLGHCKSNQSPDPGQEITAKTLAPPLLALPLPVQPTCSAGHRSTAVTRSSGALTEQLPDTGPVEA